MIEWNETFSVGDDRTDSQHKELIALLAEFQTQLSAGASKEQLHRKLEEISSYTKYHFCCEENLMAAVGFPELSAHSQRHQILLDILGHIVNDLDSGKYTATQIEGFLVQWFMDHLVDEDSKIGEFLKSRSNAV